MKTKRWRRRRMMGGKVHIGAACCMILDTWAGGCGMLFTFMQYGANQLWTVSLGVQGNERKDPPPPNKWGME